MKLANAVVVITGASQGIGRASAIKLAEAGCLLTLTARTAEPLQELARSLGQDRVLVVPADVSQPSAAAEIARRTEDRFGRIDVLVNNAGLGIYGPAATVSLAEARQVMAVNFFGPWQLMQACIPIMQKNGGGLIINVSSIIGRRSTPSAGGYCASKAALEHLVEAMRVELAPQNIRFSTLYPGVTQTDFVPRSLGFPTRRRGRVKGVPAEKVADRLLKTARKEPRDAYVTLFDWTYVTGSRLWPGLVDWVLARYFK